MKVVQYAKYGAPEVLKINEMDKPGIKENEVLIKVYTSTVTAVDSIFRSGNHFFARLATGLIKPKNTIPGDEFAGSIDLVGSKVKTFKVGDEVFGSTNMGHGAYAEYISLPADGTLLVKPPKLNFEEAAAVPSGTLTALHFLRDTGNIKSGQRILIIGASGSIGTYAVQLAKLYGAEVTGVCGTSNIELVKSLGTDEVIDYSKEDFTKIDDGYHLVFDTVGKSSFSNCKKILKRNGLYLTTVISFTILFQMLLTSIMGNKKAVIAFAGLRTASDKTKDLAQIKKLIEDGHIRVVIDKIYSMEQVSDAHSYVDAGHKKGNVVLRISQDSI